MRVWGRGVRCIVAETGGNLGIRLLADDGVSWTEWDGVFGLLLIPCSVVRLLFLLAGSDQ